MPDMSDEEDKDFEDGDSSSKLAAMKSLMQYASDADDDTIRPKTGGPEAEGEGLGGGSFMKGLDPGHSSQPDEKKQKGGGMDLGGLMKTFGSMMGK